MECVRGGQIFADAKMSCAESPLCLLVRVSATSHPGPHQLARKAGHHLRGRWEQDAAFSRPRKSDTGLRMVARQGAAGMDLQRPECGVGS